MIIMGKLSSLFAEVTRELTTGDCDTCGQPFSGYTLRRKGEVFYNPTTCRACLDKAVKEQDELADNKSRLIDIDSRREKTRLSCGIPAKFQKVRFDNFDRKRPGNVGKVCQVCIKYADNYNLADPKSYKSLVLTSSRIWGNGKTHLVCSIMHRILDRWNGERSYGYLILDKLFVSILYITEYDMFERIQRTYNKDKVPGQETEDKVFELLTEVGLLVVDDVGKVARSDSRFVQSTWFKIVDKRDASELPIVLTCNLNHGEFFSHFGGEANQATYSRLMDMAKGNSFEIDSPSYRNIKEGK